MDSKIRHAATTVSLLHEGVILQSYDNNVHLFLAITIFPLQL